jgi:hypothetical protein
MAEEAPTIEFSDRTQVVLTITVKDADGAAKNVTGYAFRFTFENHKRTTIFTKETGGSGIVLTTAASGIITVTIAGLASPDIDFTGTAEADGLHTGNEMVGRYELIEYSGGSLAGTPTSRVQGSAIVTRSVYRS